MPQHICCRERADTSVDDHDIMRASTEGGLKNFPSRIVVADTKIFGLQGGGAAGFDQEGRIDRAPSRNRTATTILTKSLRLLFIRDSHRMGVLCSFLSLSLPQS